MRWDKHSIQKIAVLRAGALGDFIVCLPALKALKLTFPAAELVLLGESWQKGFVTGGRTPVDRVVEMPFYPNIRYGGKSTPEELSGFFRKLRGEGFDLALHLQGKGIAASPVLRQLGARFTAGYTSPGAEKLDLALPFFYYQNEITRCLELTRALGCVPVDPVPEVSLLPEDMEEARRVRALKGIEGPYIVLHAWAKDMRRMWPMENFARLGDALARRGYSIIFTGSATEKPSTEKLLGLMRERAVHCCGELSLGGLGGLLAESLLVISNDSGPLHLARATGASSVGIYWAPNFINWGSLSFVRHRPVISWEMRCPHCGVIPNEPHPFEPALPHCRHEVSFVREIPVEDVLEAARELLATEKSNQYQHAAEKDSDIQGLAVR